MKLLFISSYSPQIRRMAERLRMPTQLLFRDATVGAIGELSDKSLRELVTMLVPKACFLKRLAKSTSPHQRLYANEPPRLSALSDRT